MHRPMSIEQYESRIQAADGEIVIQASKGRMIIATLSDDDGKGHLVHLTPRQVMELKGAIVNFENTSIRNGW